MFSFPREKKKIRGNKSPITFLSPRFSLISLSVWVRFSKVQWRLGEHVLVTTSLDGIFFYFVFATLLKNAQNQTNIGASGQILLLFAHKNLFSGRKVRKSSNIAAVGIWANQNKRPNNIFAQSVQSGIFICFQFSNWLNKERTHTMLRVNLHHKPKRHTWKHGDIFEITDGFGKLLRYFNDFFFVY